MAENGDLALRRERLDVVRRMQASVLAVDPMLDAMCEGLADAMVADAVLVTLLLEDRYVFIGSFGLKDHPGSMDKGTADHADRVLGMSVFEELRLDENPVFDAHPMVHGPFDHFRSTITVGLTSSGMVVGSLNVMTRHHRSAPYDEAALAKLYRGRTAIEAHLAFGVLIRAPKG